MCLAAPSGSHSPPETPRFQRWGWLAQQVSPPQEQGLLCTCAHTGSHLHAPAVHPDHLGPQALDPTQEGLLVLCQSDAQAQDVSAK